jgi:hypothetical protein
MAAAVCLREDYDAARLRGLAKRSPDAAQTRRLLALAVIYDGGSRGEAATTGGVGRQTVRDWVLAFNTKGPPGLVNGKASGNPPLLTPAHRQALLEIVESGPIPAVHGVVRWAHASVIPDTARVSASEPAKASSMALQGPPLDLREIDDETSAFAPEGFCPWRDRRRGWVAKQRKAKRAPQRKKRSQSGKADVKSAAT